MLWYFYCFWIIHSEIFTDFLDDVDKYVTYNTVLYVMAAEKIKPKHVKTIAMFCQGDPLI